MIFKRGKEVTAQGLTDIFQDLVIRANSVSELSFTAGQVFDHGKWDDELQVQLEAIPVLLSQRVVVSAEPDRLPFIIDTDEQSATFLVVQEPRNALDHCLFQYFINFTFLPVPSQA